MIRSGCLWAMHLGCLWGTSLVGSRGRRLGSSTEATAQQWCVAEAKCSVRTGVQQLVRASNHSSRLPWLPRLVPDHEPQLAHPKLGLAESDAVKDPDKEGTPRRRPPLHKKYRGSTPKSAKQTMPHFAKSAPLHLCHRYCRRSQSTKSLL